MGYAQGRRAQRQPEEAAAAAETMRPLPDPELAPFPEIERASFGTGWWRYSESRTAEREVQYRDSARSVQGVLLVLQGIGQRVLYGRRRWKPPRVDAKRYVVEEGVG